MTGKDRRSCQRSKTYGVGAWLLGQNVETERCSIIDASRNGVLIKSSLFILPGTTIELAFIRKQGPNVIRVFRRWAKVARTSHHDIAVYFVKDRRVTNSSSRAIRSYPE
jgi:hypothetical protein